MIDTMTESIQSSKLKLDNDIKKLFESTLNNDGRDITLEGQEKVEIKAAYNFQLPSDLPTNVSKDYWEKF